MHEPGWMISTRKIPVDALKSTPSASKVPEQLLFCGIDPKSTTSAFAFT